MHTTLSFLPGASEPPLPHPPHTQRTVQKYCSVMLCSTASPPSNAPRRIVSLPPSVTARLRSTLAITSLTQAVSELVQNSLDANPRHIKIQVNFLRNSCVVGDDGCGIPPEDVPLIGKRYSTSKYCPDEGNAPSTFGHLGITLASLASLSTLTVLSRASTHRSTSLVRFSYSDTPLSAPSGYYAPDHLRLTHSGTTIRLEALFGNLPVRIKAQQASLDEEREWEELKRILVALLLARHGGMPNLGITLRDFAGNKKVVIKPRMNVLDGSNEEEEGEDQGAEGGGGSGAELRLLQQVYTPKEIGSTSSWERIRARRGNVTMEGWISTTGSPSRRYQFISINSHPLPPPPQSTNALHATLNQLFSKSTFGTVIDPMERGTKLAQKPRKGVDRYPKCILRIICARNHNGEPGESGAVLIGGEGGTGDASSGKGGMEGENLKGCVELLKRLVEQFLEVHGFQKRGGIEREDEEASESEGRGEEARDGAGARTVRKFLGTATANHKGAEIPRRMASATPRPVSSGDSSVSGCRRMQTRSMARGASVPQLSTLSGWGNKVKSARRDPVEEEGRQVIGVPKIAKSTAISPPTSAKTPSTITISEDENDDEEEAGACVETAKEDCEDFLHWCNPMTNHVAHVDPRTGNARLFRSNAPPNSGGIVAKQRISLRTSRPPTPAVESIMSEGAKRLKLSTAVPTCLAASSVSTGNVTIADAEPIPRDQIASPKRGAFITSLLEKWKNPVFALQPEPPIPALGPTQAVLTLQQQMELHHCSSSHFVAPGEQDGLKDMMLQGFGVERLSKKGLRQGRVIGQVDKKFVLMAMKVVKYGEADGEVLLVIDQHAADERWRVEKLMEELCREIFPQEQGPKDNSPEVGQEEKVVLLLPAGDLAKTSVEPVDGVEIYSKITTVPVPPNKPLKYPITPTESSMLSKDRYRKEFAAWGVLYTITLSHTTTTEQQPMLTLTHLPKIVFDRGATEPTIPIDLVRGHLWDLSERKAAGWVTGETSGGRGVDGGRGKGKGWVERMRFAPKKLVEVVNSRACRSAIMFGDGLGKGECVELVGRLVGWDEERDAKEREKEGEKVMDEGCKFPFMCAHGRPSMVPLVRMSTSNTSQVAGGEYTFTNLGLGEGIGGGVGGSGCVVGDARVPWVGERRYAEIGGEMGPAGGKRGLGYKEAYAKWRAREKEREREKEVDMDGDGDGGDEDESEADGDVEELRLHVCR
ncbi:hypothetical protein L211DRAFT_833602 [Terfezia boudieri ATCC MYA-4762]|uniref:MutL C-terminal dimerisation domain-containing protein n=1 Tax=Terfezia boudieri ATCC MYA-4762 TaxID=1051890 RepID=A0A3N4M0N8_9PEZI|nr:hypothetical protein L211DRAFT_833602 [Terfezia boudieri ATCC MYA-4762]